MDHVQSLVTFRYLEKNKSITFIRIRSGINLVFDGYTMFLLTKDYVGRECIPHVIGASHQSSTLITSIFHVQQMWFHRLLNRLSHVLFKPGRLSICDNSWKSQTGKSGRVTVEVMSSWRTSSKRDIGIIYLVLLTCTTLLWGLEARGLYRSQIIDGCICISWIKDSYEGSSIKWAFAFLWLDTIKKTWHSKTCFSNKLHRCSLCALCLNCVSLALYCHLCKILELKNHTKRQRSVVKSPSRNPWPDYLWL